MSKALDGRTRVWLLVSIAVGLIPILGFLAIDLRYGGQEGYLKATAQMFKFLAIVSLASALINFVACFKVEGVKKIIPVILVVISIAIIVGPWFNYRFSGYSG